MDTCGFCHKCCGVTKPCNTKATIYSWKRHVQRCTGTNDLTALGLAEEDPHWKKEMEGRLRANRSTSIRKRTRSVVEEPESPDSPPRKPKKAPGFPCSFCKVVLQKQAYLTNHPCLVMQPKDESEERRFKTYKLKKTSTSELARLVSKQSPLNKHEILYQERIAVPEEYPPMSIPTAWRRVNFNRVGTTRGNNFLEKALREKVKLGNPNSITLDGYIKIVDENDQVLRYLTPEVLAPSSNSFFVVVNEDKIIVSLKNPPKIDQMGHLKDQPLDNDPSLREYSKYKKDQNYPHSPHRYEV